MALIESSSLFEFTVSWLKSLMLIFVPEDLVMDSGLSLSLCIPVSGEPLLLSSILSIPPL